MADDDRGREPKPTADDARLLRIGPSTNPDGLDLTVAEFNALSVELRQRTFGVSGLGEVPLVGKGHPLDRAPGGCRWYVRFEAAPKEPGEKGRKQDRYVLVVKAMRTAEGGAALASKVHVLEAKEAEAALLEALVFLARKSGRRIRMSSWPVERIESLSCRDLLERYRKQNLGPRPDGKEDAHRKKKTRRTYDQAVRAFQRAFPEKEIGDLKDHSLAREYEVRTGRPATSRYADLKTVRMCLNGQLAADGALYAVKLHNPKVGRLKKTAWTVDEYDRLLKAAEGFVFEPGGAPKMVDGPDGPVQMRRPAHNRVAWRRAIEFLPYTASRHGRLPLTRWVPPEVEPTDGLPLPKDDRPWIEVTGEGIFYHRDGEVDHASNKGRKGNMIPAQLAPDVLAWLEADIAENRQFVFHRCDGQRYRGPKLGWQTFKWIVRDAGIVGRRIPHHLKDLAKEWAEAAKLRLEAFAEHADTSAETLSETYGDALRAALLQEAAEELTQDAWRAKGSRRTAIAERFAAGRTQAAESGPGPVRRKPVPPPSSRRAAGKQVQAAGKPVEAAGKRVEAAGMRPQPGQVRAAGKRV